MWALSASSGDKAELQVDREDRRATFFYYSSVKQHDHEIVWR